MRLTAIAKARVPRMHVTLPDTPVESFACTSLYSEGTLREAQLYRREELALDQQICGPALVVQSDANNVYPIRVEECDGRIR